jgi:hypothetical protein
MRSKLFFAFLASVLLISGCSQSYNGPYATTPLVTKDGVNKQIAIDKSLISSNKTPLLKQVQAKADIKYFNMLLICYDNFEKTIRSVDGKKYTLTATMISRFIKANHFENDLQQIEPNKERWPSIFLGNLARYFSSLGFGVYVDPNVKEENIVITW